MNRCPHCGSVIHQPNIRPSEYSMQKQRIKYGRYKGHYKWDLALEWFQTDNDTFFERYGFNFVPRGELFNKAKEFLAHSIFNGASNMNAPNIAPKLEINLKPNSEPSVEDIAKKISQSLFKNASNSILP